jgi:predicted RNA-binding protein associated with RNAse of E/G family
MEKDFIITKWVTLNPRKDISRGISAYYLDKGFKISKVYDKNNKVVYWYCDIIDVCYDKPSDTYTINDLLIDIKIMPDGEIRVLDADELAEAVEKRLISTEQACKALRTLDSLLKLIYSKHFPPAECKGFEY